MKWVLLFILLFIIFASAGCTTIGSVTPCANIKTHNTTWQVGIKANRGGITCSDEGIDNDLLEPDIYTSRHPW